MMELRVSCVAKEPAPEKLLTQRLSHSQGIHTASWDTEEKLRQLTWHLILGF